MFLGVPEEDEWKDRFLQDLEWIQRRLWKPQRRVLARYSWSEFLSPSHLHQNIILMNQPKPFPLHFPPLLGNELLHNLTSVGPVSLRVDMGSGNDTAYAHYASFSIDSVERHYTLTVSGYSGTAGENFIKVQFSWTCAAYIISYRKCLTIHTSMSLYFFARWLYEVP